MAGGTSVALFFQGDLGDPMSRLRISDCAVIPVKREYTGCGRYLAGNGSPFRIRPASDRTVLWDQKDLCRFFERNRILLCRYDSPRLCIPVYKNGAGDLICMLVPVTLSACRRILSSNLFLRNRYEKNVGRVVKKCRFCLFDNNFNFIFALMNQAINRRRNEEGR